MSSRKRTTWKPADMKPIPMLIWCPMCGERHIDKGDFATRSHYTHSCQGCGHTWRPAIVPTVGVQFLPGFKDQPDIIKGSLSMKDICDQFGVDPQDVRKALKELDVKSEYTETVYVVDLVPGQFAFYVRSLPRNKVMSALEPPWLFKAHLFDSAEDAEEVIRSHRRKYPYARVVRLDVRYTATPDPSMT